jgi:hypothetical protein
MPRGRRACETAVALFPITTSRTVPSYWTGLHQNHNDYWTQVLISSIEKMAPATPTATTAKVHLLLAQLQHTN